MQTPGLEAVILIAPTRYRSSTLGDEPIPTTATLNPTFDLVAFAHPPEVQALPHDERELIEQITQVLELLQGKWKAHLVFLMARGVHRHGQLLAALPGASKKMMTDTLRALERDGLVARRIFAEVPLRVEYSLTRLGWAITQPLLTLAEWHIAYGDDIEAARLRHRFDGVETSERKADPSA